MSVNPAAGVLLVGGDTDLRAACRERLVRGGLTVLEVDSARGAPPDSSLVDIRSGPFTSATRPASAVVLLRASDPPARAATTVDDLASGLDPGGSIVLVGPPGRQGDRENASVEVSRALLLTLARTRARSLAPRHRINALLPGLLGPANGETPTTTAPERNGRPGDVASAVLFLVSEGSRFVTGTALRVDGGASRRWPLALDEV